MSRIKRSFGKNSPLLKNIFLFIFCFGLFINIFVYWPAAKIAFEIPKVWFVNRYIEILGLAGLLFSPILIKKEKLNTGIIFLAIIFFVIVLVSSLLGVNFAKSFWGNYYRADGIFTLTHLFILFLITALFIRKEFIGPVIVSISLSSILISLWSLINAAAVYVFKNPSFFVWSEGIGVNFGNPNFLAGYLVVTLPFTKYLYDKQTDYKNAALLGLVIQIVAIFLTKAWAGLFGIIIFFLLTFFFAKRKNYFFPLFVILSLVIVFVLFYRQIKYQQTPGVIIAESRERIIKKGLLAFTEKPWLGWGWANFDYAFDAVVWPVKFKPDAYVDKAHSHLLEILVTTGVVGFAAYLFLIFQIGKNLWKSKDSNTRYFLLFFILFILHTQTNVISISEEILFWITAGVSAKKYNKASVPSH